MASKRARPVSVPQATMRGLVPLPDRSGYSVDLGQVKPSHQEFSARGFWTLFDDGEFVATFGWKPRSIENEPDDRFDLAVAFSLTVDGLKKFVGACWTEKTLVKDKKFVESVQEAISAGDREWAETYKCTSGLPKKKDTAMREFPASIVSATLWNGRGYLEFLEISSAVIRADHDGRARDSDPVHSLAIVVMPPKLLYAFLVAAKNELDRIEE
jgi:hypothetical protein